jgi:hypothetical protein
VTEFSPEMPLQTGCTSATRTENSALRVQEYSTLEIHYNTMHIRLYF